MNIGGLSVACGIRVAWSSANRYTALSFIAHYPRLFVSWPLRPFPRAHPAPRYHYIGYPYPRVHLCSLLALHRLSTPPCSPVLLTITASIPSTLHYPQQFHTESKPLQTPNHPSDPRQLLNRTSICQSSTGTSPYQSLFQHPRFVSSRWPHFFSLQINRL